MVGRSVAVVLALVFVLSGCAGKPDPAKDPPIGDLQVKATETTGVIRGLVVDDAIRPLANATVKVSPGNQTTTTNGNGAFGFEGLAPGTYFLNAAKKGYTSVQQSALVVADVDEPPLVRIMVSQLASSKPYHDVIKFNGNQAFAVTAFLPHTGVLNDHPRFVSSVFLFNGTFVSSFEYSPSPTWEQNLIVWEPKTALAAGLQVDQCVYLKDSDKCLFSNSTWGPSPIIMDSDAKLQQVFAGNSSGLVEDLTVWSSGATGMNPDADLGIAADQDFHIFTVHTYNYRPPAGYRFDKDGEPVDPIGG
ncbi:MAG TPA: carboxypeptidase-like regulatory domain-containing protein [Candidatus Thermoplasmatota archaeon]|nr:carboxypeptidase-like regulatory domain-containing protein [Candidatus Thermoplasmatota archaeon]